MRNKQKSVFILLLGLIAGVVFWKYPRQQDVSTHPATTNNNSTVNTGAHDITPTTLPQAEVSPSRPNLPTTYDPQPITYPLHTNITATVFWVGEPVGNGSSEDNTISAWDDTWHKHFGCFDDPEKRTGYFPAGCTPKENPFYLDLPYNDFTDGGDRKLTALKIVPWAKERAWTPEDSLMKNQWVKVTRDSITCYGQIEDAGPYEYDDAHYVFGTKDERPKSSEANNAGMDVSPALRDCLKFEGMNNDLNKVSWQFTRESEVPVGPWKQIITTSQVHWQ